MADHDSGSHACLTERRVVVRVPAASTGAVSSVHAFQVGRESGIGVTVGGKFFTVETAREYAAKIVATCDQVTR